MRLDNKKYISPFWDINCSRNSHASDECERHIYAYGDFGGRYCNIPYHYVRTLQNGRGEEISYGRNMIGIYHRGSRYRCNDYPLDYI